MSGVDAMTVLKGVCLASGAAMHVAPLPTMREIRAARNTLNFHIAPYASTLLNHLVNLWYAIIRRDGPLIIHRICGIGAQAYYNVTYLTYCPPHKQADSRRWLTWVGGILIGIFAWLHVVLPLFGLVEQYNAHIGFFGAITGIGLAASPLATVVRRRTRRTRWTDPPATALRFPFPPTPLHFSHPHHPTPSQGEVLRTKDASSLPVHLCAMVTLQCFSWMVYGYLRDDLSTFSNNLVGVVLGSIQLTLIWMYGSTRKSASGGGGGAGGSPMGGAAVAGVGSGAGGASGGSSSIGVGATASSLSGSSLSVARRGSGSQGEDGGRAIE
jgi:hypothetical protein